MLFFGFLADFFGAFSWSRDETQVAFIAEFKDNKDKDKDKAKIGQYCWAFSLSVLPPPPPPPRLTLGR